MTTTISPATKQRLLRYQKEEVNGAILYDYMSRCEKNPANKSTLAEMATQETSHAEVWGRYSGESVSAGFFHILWYKLLIHLLGFTFVLKLMEKDEALTVSEYRLLVDEVPEMRAIMEEEERHEANLQSMLDEERLHYVGAMVLGLNDALVELTGTIAGLTFALAHNRLVAMAGIITGVSATLSMAASNYLAQRADGSEDAVKSSVYTSVAYLITVVFLILPYLLFPPHMYWGALLCMLLVVVGIIFFFNYYIAVAKEQPFWPRFFEMACISLGVAVISFLIGLAAKRLLNIEV